MGFFSRVLRPTSLITIFSAIVAGLCLGQTPTSQLRFMSVTIRDTPPTLTEVQAFLAGEQSMSQLRDTWLSSPEHKARILRFFNDMLGVSDEHFLMDDSHLLHQTTDGVYYSEVKASCSLGAAEAVTAWWVQEGETVLACPAVTSGFISQGSSGQSGYLNCIDATGSNGFAHPNCGCGPDMILCLPSGLGNALRDAMRFEFAQRGLYAYEEGLSWHDLLAGDFVYANRFLYYFYLQRQVFGPSRSLPLSEHAKLKSLPLNTYTVTSFPSSGGARAGAVTAPGFLAQYNNFRSRIRALSLNLLCRDIDASLNTDGVSVFKNSDFSSADLSHGSKEDCAGCHYPLDNMGSTLLGWSDQGFYNTWASPSQIGHVFGLEGSGPAFLASGLIERGPGFSECMAKRTWESFSGMPWEALNSEQKNGILDSVDRGPRHLIQSVLSSDLLTDLRVKGLSPHGPTAQAITYADIRPILLESCSGGGCHSTGTSLGRRYDYLSDETYFKDAPSLRLSNNSMPPAGSGMPLSSQQRERLVQYLNGK